MATITTSRTSAPMPTGIASGVGFAGAIVATILAVAVGSTHDPLWALVPLGVVTAGVASVTSWTGAVVTAWICWSLDSGFVLGREAQLTFSPAAGVAALTLVAVALAGGLVGRWVRMERTARVEPAGQPIQSANEAPDNFS
ncbi:hypothetical protein ABIB25_001547 [Nakamurella sp. UYEF19]|uniref:hypothetical protein n=1 Tax=Nakamurella sp. UYEF19 TaxID=1756392 RepID=UPI003395A39A